MLNILTVVEATMRDFELVDEDYLPASGSKEFDVVSSNEESDYQESTMLQSGFYFEDLKTFISDSRIIVGILSTVIIGILIPILGNLCFKIYIRMADENLFKFKEPNPADDEDSLIEEENEEPEEPEPPKPLKHVEFENVQPENLNMTEEERILMAAAIDADDQEYDMLKAFNRVKLHGKLATARLRAKTLKIESGMTEEEREQERKTKNEQIAKIFAMMEQNSDKFGIQSEEELKEQMKLYSV